MKIREESEWQRQLSDFANDPNPMATALQNFLITWANYAEGVIAEVETDEPDAEVDVMWCLRQTLATTETHTGRISIGFIGSALTLLTMHWAYGETLYDDMNAIERHLVEDATLLKLEQLAAQAQEETGGI